MTHYYKSDGGIEKMLNYTGQRKVHMAEGIITKFGHVLHIVCAFLKKDYLQTCGICGWP